jgi:hypothetical protein
MDPSTYTITHDSTCTKHECKTIVTYTTQPTKSIVSFPFACLDPSYPFFGKFDI